MIEEVDGRLADWARSVAGDHPVTHGAPDDSRARQAVSLFLLDLLPSPPGRGGVGPPPLQFTARYLVTTSIHDEVDGHALLSRLVFSAMENAEMEVEFHGLPFESWIALGAQPRPYFLIRMPVRRHRKLPEAKPVLHPMVVEVGGMTSLRGNIVGPDSTPWPGARVELPSLQMATRTDVNGYFQFNAIPREPGKKRLRITAKRRVFEVEVAQPPAPREPVRVQLDPTSTEP